MEYICHKRYHKVGASGKSHNFPRGSILSTVSNYIAKDAEGICLTTSDDAYRHFARNDDGKGLERGALTYAIAYSKRHPNKDNGFRFTEEEREMLCSDYGFFIKEENEYLVFNYDFFNADIEELKELATKLNMEVK